LGIAGPRRKIQYFRVEDKFHMRSMEIFAMANELEKWVNDAESVPNIDLFCAA